MSAARGHRSFVFTASWRVEPPWRGEKREEVNTAEPFGLKVLDTARECWYRDRILIFVRERRGRVLERCYGEWVDVILKC